MRATRSAWISAVAFCLITFLLVFVAPFLFPPALTSSVSESNSAGFNNKLASVFAVLCACGVFTLSLKRPAWFGGTRTVFIDDRPLSKWLITLTCSVALLGTASAIAMVQYAHVRYPRDAGYFINQMSSSLYYHQKLWSQIEFPYGPMLFYPPIALKQIFSTDRFSLQNSYYLTFLIEQAAGLGVLVYLVNRLPMKHNWRIVAFLFSASLTCQPLLGANYTLLRFLAPFGALLFSFRRRNIHAFALCLGLGELLNLSISAEMGFAFMAGAVTYVMLQSLREGMKWLLGLLAVCLAATSFLLAVGRPFLQMLLLFAGGTFNLVIRPLPFILVFLVALVWLVPSMLANRIRARDAEANTLGALFVASVALVPVAFGRADAPHVLFNGLGLFLLSCVAASRLTKSSEVIWGVCMVIAMCTGIITILELGSAQAGGALRQLASRTNVSPFLKPGQVLIRHILPNHRVGSYVHPGSPPFEIGELKQITGSESVATPQEVDLPVEEALKREHMFRPSFFYYMTAVLDRRAEQRKVNEFNQARWALLPPQLMLPDSQESHMSLVERIFHRGAYPSTFVSGAQFEQNLRQNWRSVGTDGGYTIYSNTMKNVSGK